MKALIDSNILIDFLNQHKPAKKELGLYQDKYISIITYIEVLVGATTAEEGFITKEFLSNFKIIYIDSRIAQETIRLKKIYKLKLGDALIIATGAINDLLIVTRDKKDFSNIHKNIKIPYTM